MLTALPAFKADAVAAQMKAVRGFFDVADKAKHAPEAWQPALIAAAKAAKVKRVITDHPDLADKDFEGIDFLSTEAWLVERTIPPPFPPPK
jgi:hypothetical protein